MNISGCGGTPNNFRSRQECVNFCYSTACPVGLMPMYYQAQDLVQTCANLGSGSCPGQYICLRDALRRENVCCGPSTADVCPENRFAFLDPFQNTTFTCRPVYKDDCTRGNLKKLFKPFFLIFQVLWPLNANSGRI